MMLFPGKACACLNRHSEHHTGLSVDIIGEDYQCLDEEQAEKRPEAIWLAEHCASMGLVFVRYDRGKEDITGMDYESWHFRYVEKRRRPSWRSMISAWRNFRIWLNFSPA